MKQAPNSNAGREADAHRLDQPGRAGASDGGWQDCPRQPARSAVASYGARRHLVVLHGTRSQAERASARLTSVLADLGLESLALAQRGRAFPRPDS
jgi:hypothetical protein